MTNKLTTICYIIAILLIISGLIFDFVWDKTSVGTVAESTLAIGQVNGTTEEYIAGQSASNGKVKSLIDLLIFGTAGVFTLIGCAFGFGKGN